MRLTSSLFTAETTYNNITEINSKANNSLTSHTLHREEGSGLQLMSCKECNYQTALLDNEMLISAKHIVT